MSRQGQSGSPDPTRGAAPPLRPSRAPVVPRVTCTPGGAALPLQQRITSLLEGGARGTVSLHGPPGSGKTTALAHLAAFFHDQPRLRLHDGGSLQRIQAEAGSCVVVCASRSPLPDAFASYGMAPWGEDDCVEYLAATCRQRCASVMARVTASDNAVALGGSPELWRIVLDELAADESLADVTEALRHHLAASLDDPVARDAAMTFSLGVCSHEADRRTGWAEAAENALSQHLPKLIGPGVARLLRHRPVRVLLAGQRILWELCGDVRQAFPVRTANAGSALGSPALEWALTRPLPPDLVREAAGLARCRPAALQRLAAMVRGDDVTRHATAASLLHAANVGWRPPASPLGNTGGMSEGKNVRPWLRLSGAVLSGARWAGVDLSGVLMKQADLSRADLRSAKLDGARAARAVLRAASLRGASLRRIRAVEADFDDADLTAADADGANFEEADLQRADLSHAILSGAKLKQANLGHAVLREADLSNAKLEETNLKEADLSCADFSGATLRRLRLREAACLSGARFRRASLLECDLERVELAHADLRGAVLTGSCLTAACMVGADLRGANLRDTGLADVNWQRANLRDADLTGATFHMGSTRCGLVAAPATPLPACEGSRTGFYTDEYDEKGYKSPEEIRRANLCGADLRGAKVKGVDFYLVDLRGARYTEKQGRHFRRCGAILDDPR